MSNLWQDSYRQLDTFIQQHPEIQISETRVSIPDPVRDEFYRRFDRVTERFVRENYLVLPAQTSMLLACYHQLEDRLSADLGLVRIGITPGLDIFLHDPQRAMAKTLFDLLFEVLQGKSTLAAFESHSAEHVDAMLTEQSRLAYPYWVMLSLLRSLAPDEIFRVVPDHTGVPTRQSVREIELGNPVSHPVLRFPEFVLHSARLEKYLAFKFELDRELGTYTTDNRAERKRSIRDCGNTFAVMSTRTILLYVLNQPDEIPIVANLNTRRVSPPDLLVEFLDGDPTIRERISRHLEILQPRRGIFAVECRSRSAPPFPVPGQDIPVLLFEPTSLWCEPLLDTLKNT